ncbi:MAG: (2Fe-2S)-binding protein [Arenicellales bacterium]
MNSNSGNRFGRFPGEQTNQNNRVTFQFDGQTVHSYAGESVAAALIAAGVYATRLSEKGMPRGYFCGMGVCWECIVRINGISTERACRQTVEDGMFVETVKAVKKEWPS